MPESLQKKLDLEITAMQPVSGGDIADSYRIEAASGESYFLKTLSNAPADMFIAEATGLSAIAATNTITTPRVIQAGDDFLLLEYLPPSRPTENYWQRFGHELAQLHKTPQINFGFEIDNYCGRTPQINAQADCGFTFFGQHRLGFQADLATGNGLLTEPDREAIQKLIDKLPELIPVQPPALIHGDLWSGNHLCAPGGIPTLIDPAAHRGWAEAEIAMTTLFGGFPEVFHQAYLEVNPLKQGWRERLPLYNLYHLLNHLNLFGRGYYQQVKSIINFLT